jgi:hypothetical protein
MWINLAGFGLILLIVWWFWMYKSPNVVMQDGAIEIVAFALFKAIVFSIFITFVFGSSIKFIFNNAIQVVYHRLSLSLMLILLIT